MNLKRIYKTSIRVALKNKVLWVLGMALAAFSGAGFNLRFNNVFRDWSPKAGGAEPGLEQTLNSFTPLLLYIKELFSQIPFYFWFLLILGIFLAFSVGLMIQLVAKNWAKGAIIGAVDDVLKKKKVNLGSGSEHGLRSFKSLIWLSLVPWFLYALVFLSIGGSLIALALVLSDETFSLVMVVLIFFLVFSGLIVALAIAATQIWAGRVVVIERKPAKEAFFEGWRLARKNILKMIVLGGLNWLISCFLSCLIIFIFLPLVGGGLGLLALNRILGIAFFSTLVLTILPFLFFSILFRGIFLVFNYSTWNVLYREIRKGKKDE